jgi:hypothetical protein
MGGSSAHAEETVPLSLITMNAPSGRIPAWGPFALGVGAAIVLGGCGRPPEPLPTAPPRPTITGSAAASATAYPGGWSPAPPTAIPTVPPGDGIPVPTPVVPPTTVPPSPAPKCRSGPTAAQILAAIRGKPGVPVDEPLRVSSGPFCAGTWQFAAVGLQSDPDDKKSDPLLVVTRGRPTALTVIEAGADVCSDRVQGDAPAGIRVLACGA